MSGRNRDGEHFAGTIVGPHANATIQPAAAQHAHRMGEPHSLRVAAGARCEDHQHGIRAADFPVRHKGFRGGDGFPVRRPVDIDDGGTAQIETVEQRHVLGIGEHQLTVRAPDVARQAPATARRVDPAQYVPAERRRGHRPQHGRRIAQQRPDMHRPRRVGERDERRRLGRRFGQMLSPRPRLIAVPHRHRVVVHAGPQQLLHCLNHRRAGSAAG